MYQQDPRNGARGAASGKLSAVLAVLAVAAVVLYKLTSGLGFESPVVAAGRDGAAIRQGEFQALLDRKKPLSSLALPGQYTVVEVYLDSCAICRRLESGFAEFSARRGDVSIRRVHFPENGIHFSVTGNSQEEIDREMQAFSQLMESYQVCGTPHVEIFGPDQAPISRDQCGDKSGTKFLRRWMASETGLSLDRLLTGAGADAVTALPDGR